MIRGIEHRKIFLNNKDREDFLERHSKLLPETKKTACYAWVFIPNHAHFLFRTGLVPLARAVRWSEQNDRLVLGNGQKKTYPREDGLRKRGSAFSRPLLPLTVRTSYAGQGVLQ